ncbi:MAG: amidohydrolase [Bryobacteraceae bacterium]|nr:amidohydrolase [Bryobacteraceae bacterium]
MRHQQRIYDTHTHLGRGVHSGRIVTARDLLVVMDSAGVDRAVVIPYPVVADYRAEHDTIGAAVLEHPERFAGTLGFPAFLPLDTMREEARRCRDAWAPRALKLQPQYQPINPLSRWADDWFSLAAEFDLTLIIHTGMGIPFTLPSLWMLPARRYPNVRVVLGHAGGPLFHQEAIVAASFLDNIFIDVSTLAANHVAEILKHIPASRLMLGSDLPECTETEMEKPFALSLPPADLDAICWSTARRIFDREHV